MPAVWIPESRGPPEQTTCFKCKEIGHYRRDCENSWNAAKSRAKSRPQSSSADGELGRLIALVEQLQTKIDSVSARLDKLSTGPSYADVVKSDQRKDNAKPALQLSLTPDIESQFLSSPAGQRMLQQMEMLVAENSELRFELQQRGEWEEDYYPSEMHDDYAMQLPLLEHKQSGSSNRKIPTLPELKALTPSALATTTTTSVADARLSTDIRHTDSGASSLPSVEKKAMTPISSATPAATATTTPEADSKLRINTAPDPVSTKQRANAQNQTLTSVSVLPTLANAKPTVFLKPVAPEFLIIPSQLPPTALCACDEIDGSFHEHLFFDCPTFAKLASVDSILPDRDRDVALDVLHEQLYNQLTDNQDNYDVLAGKAAAAKRLYSYMPVFDPDCCYCHSYFRRDPEGADLFRRAFAIDTANAKCIAPDVSSSGLQVDG